MGEEGGGGGLERGVARESVNERGGHCFVAGPFYSS